MLVEQLKHKYRQILEDEDFSDEEKIPNHAVPLQPASDMDRILNLKTKLAQCIKNVGDRDAQIAVMQRENEAWKEENRRLHSQIILLNSKISQLDLQIEEKAKECLELEREAKKAMQWCKASRVDQELILKQVQFYRNSITALKKELKSQTKKEVLLEKEIMRVQQYKRQAEHLAEDVKRLHLVLNKEDSKLSQSLKGKHYLGRPQRECQLWFPQNLIGEVECFLKKEQVGYGNKTFESNLVKFILMEIKKNRKGEPRKRESRGQSRKQNRSINVSDVNYSTIKRTQTLADNSIIQRRFDEKTESFLCERLDKSQTEEITRKYRDGCQQILRQFKGELIEVLKQKELKRQRLMGLVDQMSGSLLGLLDSFEDLSSGTNPRQ